MKDIVILESRKEAAWAAYVQLCDRRPLDCPPSLYVARMGSALDIYNEALARYMAALNEEKS